MTEGFLAMSTETATQAAQELKLTPPDPVPTVTPQQAMGLVPVTDEQQSKLAQRVEAYVADLIAQDVNSPEFGKRVDQLTNMGRKEIMEASAQSNRFLDKPIRRMDEQSGVEDLDPSKKGNLMTKQKLFGIIPFGNKLRNYFDSYQSSQTHISSILGRLGNGKDELLMDNAAIDVERQNLWVAMGRLEQMIVMSKQLDAKLEEKAAELELSDPAKSRAIKESALFYVRQRTQDLLTQMAVTVQGYLALDLVKKNNVELVKGVDRASTTTVGALRTAVTVAQAMTNQKLVLDQITSLNTTTANIIDSTGQLLRDNTGRIHEQAAASTIPLETLSRAFQNIYDTMDAIDTFKLKALDSMKQTSEALEKEVEKSKGYIARAEGQAQALTETQDSGLLAALEG
jgi:uncharacterized protein YaaN involved in tellurite resistance